MNMPIDHISFSSFLLINFIFLVTHTPTRKNAYVCNGLSILLFPTTTIIRRRREKKRASIVRTRQSGGKKNRRRRRSTKNDNCSVRLIQHGNFLIFWFFLRVLFFFLLVIVVLVVLFILLTSHVVRKWFQSCSSSLSLPYKNMTSINYVLYCLLSFSHLYIHIKRKKNT